jgi:hypothetical protein
VRQEKQSKRFTRWKKENKGKGETLTTMVESTWNMMMKEEEMEGLRGKLFYGAAAAVDKNGNKVKNSRGSIRCTTQRKQSAAVARRVSIVCGLLWPRVLCRIGAPL